MRSPVKRRMFLPVILAAAVWCGGCVQGPLVKVGGSDKPLVDVKINQGAPDAGSDNKKGSKTPGRADESAPF